MNPEFYAVIIALIAGLALYVRNMANRQGVENSVMAQITRQQAEMFTRQATLQEELSTVRVQSTIQEAKLTNKINLLERDLTDARSAEQRFRDQLETTTAERQREIEDVRTKLSTRVYELEEQIGNMKTTIEAIRAQLETAEAERARAVAERDQAEANRKTFEADVTKRIEDAVDAVKADLLTKYDARIRELETTIRERDAEISRLRERLAQMEGNKDEAKPSE